MELKLYELRFNGGLMYRILSKQETVELFIKNLSKNDVISIEKELKFSKYLFCEHIIEVQEVDKSESLLKDAWRLTE